MESSHLRSLIAQSILASQPDTLAELLVDAQPEVLVAEGEHPSPTWVAAAFGAPDCLSQLLEASADSALERDTQGMTPATIAAHRGHAACITLLARAGAAEAHDRSGQTPAHYAAAAGHLNVLQALGADAPHTIEGESSLGLTVMDLAWNHGHERLVDWLKAQGQQDVAEKWSCGCSPGEICGPEAGTAKSVPPQNAID